MSESAKDWLKLTLALLLASLLFATCNHRGDPPSRAVPRFEEEP